MSGVSLKKLCAEGLNIFFQYGIEYLWGLDMAGAIVWRSMYLVGYIYIYELSRGFMKEPSIELFCI